MKLVRTMSIAALLVAAVVALPLSLPQASAQIPSQPDGSFSFDDTMIAHSNTTGMSFLAVFGMSMVEGAEVTGVVMSGENEVSVTIANENETGESDPVTVVAFTSTMDMMSSMFSPGPVASLMNDSSFGNSSVAATDDDDNSGPGSNGDDDNGELDDSGFDSPSDFDDFGIEDFDDDGTAFGSSASPMGLFENMKMGSSVVQQGWNSPQSVAVTLVGNNTTTPAEESDTTFVFVMIFPYTEEATQTIREG